MRFVTVKSIEEQDVQALHRIRERIVKARTAQVNQIRGFLMEYGIVVREGINWLRRRLPEPLEDGENGLTAQFRSWLAELYDEFRMLDQRILQYTGEIITIHRSDEACQRIGSIEGVGRHTATVLVSAYGQAREFGYTHALFPQMNWHVHR